jgi:serine/threonine protein kinase
MAKTFLGTTVFMSPERATGACYGPSADIWRCVPRWRRSHDLQPTRRCSLGMTLYTAATGRQPYDISLVPAPRRAT